jgi:uncharacterized protein (TIGR03435 family)
MKGIVFVAVLVTGSVTAQPKFEVASVKQASECTYHHTLGPGQVVLGFPLTPILVTAFKVSKDQIIGPSWLESDCFEVVAKLPQGSTPDQIPAMLQVLLTERFKLSSHNESRPSTIYALVVDKGGPKVKEAAENSTFMGKAPRNALAIGRSGGVIKGIMTMEMLATSLSTRGYGHIVDATGLKGEYEIRLSWAADRGMAQAASSEVASNPQADLFTALRESLGLKLEPRKTETEVLVIDHIERVPTGN